jgi:predicted nucleic acid-binding protein
MAPEAVVVDASVAVKWFNEEDFSDEAVALRDDHVSGAVIMAAPTLLAWEVCNALRHSEEMGSSDVERAFGDLLDIQVVLWGPDADWAVGAVGEAFRRGITVYDSSYLALAAHLRAPLYTADERLIAKAVDRARHISAYGR